MPRDDKEKKEITVHSDFERMLELYHKRDCPLLADVKNLFFILLYGLDWPNGPSKEEFVKKFDELAESINLSVTDYLDILKQYPSRTYAEHSGNGLENVMVRMYSACFKRVASANGWDKLDDRDIGKIAHKIGVDTLTLDTLLDRLHTSDPIFLFEAVQKEFLKPQRNLNFQLINDYLNALVDRIMDSAYEADVVKKIYGGIVIPRKIDRKECTDAKVPSKQADQIVEDETYLLCKFTSTQIRGNPVGWLLRSCAQHYGEYLSDYNDKIIESWGKYVEAKKMPVIVAFSQFAQFMIMADGSEQRLRAVTSMIDKTLTVLENQSRVKYKTEIETVIESLVGICVSCANIDNAPQEAKKVARNHYSSLNNMPAARRYLD